MYTAVFLIYFISAAVILDVSLALIVKFSVLYKSWKGYHLGLKKIKILSLQIYHLSDPRDLLNLTEIQWSHGVLSMLSHLLKIQNTVK
jgi:hypothetical protein